MKILKLAIIGTVGYFAFKHFVENEAPEKTFQDLKQKFMDLIDKLTGLKEKFNENEFVVVDEAITPVSSNDEDAKSAVVPCEVIAEFLETRDTENQADFDKIMLDAGYKVGYDNDGYFVLKHSSEEKFYCEQSNEPNTTSDII